MENPNFTLRTIESLKDHTFLVEFYQRGYKWTESQVVELLTDIDEFDRNELDQPFYCLQPIALKKISLSDERMIQLKQNDQVNENYVYELVDGQQRLTTISIILNVLTENKIPFQIDYRKRTGSKDFLYNISHYLKDYEVQISADLFNDLDMLSTFLNNEWTDFILTNSKVEDNIDNYHFFKAYQIIKNWNYANEDWFLEKLLQHSKVIWYVDQQTDIAENLFENLNSGKISLTSAELIKALFLLQIQNSTDNQERKQFLQNELAVEWDEMENQLQDDKFWSFIKNISLREYPTRIGYLFDLAQDAVKQSDSLYAYRKYQEKYRDNEELDWKEIRNLYHRLLEWYSKPKIFHRVGFLMTANDLDLNMLINLGKEKSKPEFEKELDTLVKEYFIKIVTRDKKKIYRFHIENLSYGEDKEAINRILLFFNILVYERILPDYKFPFNLFQESKWTLEHIHPQNAREIQTKEEAIEYLEEALLLYSEEAEKSKEIKHLIKDLEKSSSQLSKDNRTKVEVIEDEISARFELHKIGNLTLLEHGHNGKLGNRSFQAKRATVLQLDDNAQLLEEDKRFIPMGTLNVFTKYYTTEDLQMKYWNETDALAYKGAIEKLLKPYLPSKQFK